MKKALARILSFSMAFNALYLPVQAQSSRVESAISKTTYARAVQNIDLISRVEESQEKLKSLKHSLKYARLDHERSAPFYKGVFVTAAVSLGGLYYLTTRASPAANKSLSSSVELIALLSSIASISSAGVIVLNKVEIASLNNAIEKTELELNTLKQELESLK